MRTTLCIAAVFLFFASCKKDKFNSVPQIKFNSLKPNVFLKGTPNTDVGAIPVLSFQLTDLEGDFGPVKGTDTSYVYIKNITTTNQKDSIKFPSLSGLNKKNLDAEISVELGGTGILIGSDPPVTPHTDTLYFEVYVKDFAKHKSNTIKVGPVFYINP